MLIGDDGKVVQRASRRGEQSPAAIGTVDVKGRTVLPGMIDAHGHVMDLGFDALRLELDRQALRSPSCSSASAIMQRRIRTMKWILGGGWNQELWPGKRFPTAADLDAIVRDRPVVLERVDGHAIVANSAAMRAAGVTAATPAPARRRDPRRAVRRRRARA